MNDPFDAIALNGPDSDTLRYTFRFGETRESADDCADKILAFCRKKGQRWFRRVNGPVRLLGLPNSPLGVRERKALLMAMRGKAAPQNVQRSRELLGLR